ncbi:carbon-nitrogen hydrolase family protein [Methylobacterium nodulans]|uniref:Nitrilase/cyanide hydratase and apolipoprotein N-acyltransferase n=1 Tax=Methylobacterium nodulans (strain LMG 21967 / CNCM I-2342 / ORS 2060) TaxID=460265 RepID=B8ISY2_METNO|nr:carbon-nitrogen hydrolase family protein [Methylobacterium nodulans]ACL60781.1 Nitrilase/cyanide hydratase and apolipoprotein N-acyltransferase [Methylobacterium nodulans ORS 2060]
MTAPRFVAACVQMRSGRDPAQNRDAAVAGLREAAARGAHYVQTPEMTSLLERSRESLFAKITVPEEDITLAALREAARAHGIVVHVGSLAVRHGDKVANRAFLIGPEGEILAAYDKLHLYDVDLPNGESWRESATYTGGACAVVADLPWARLGIAICYDLRFPALYRALAEAGAEILTAPAAFTRQTGEAHWHVLQRARAIETGSFMISAAQGGRHEDGRETYGHSLIVDPWGRILAEADGAEPGVILAEIDLGLVADARARIPALRHAKPFTVETATARRA